MNVNLLCVSAWVIEIDDLAIYKIILSPLALLDKLHTSPRQVSSISLMEYRAWWYGTYRVSVSSDQ